MSQKDNQGNGKNGLGALFVNVSILVVVFFVLFNSFHSNELGVKQVNYSTFLELVNSNSILKADVKEARNGQKTIVATTTDKNSTGMNNKISVVIPSNDIYLVPRLIEKHITVEVIPEEQQNILLSFLFNMLPTVLFFVLFYYIMKKFSGGSEGLFTFNKNKAQLIMPENIKAGFNEVIGCDGAKREIYEIVDMLKNPEKYKNMKSQLPKGILLTGNSGTGKTMLAKAVAKESGVPFFATSGSAFVEMFVGVGASRIRHMFEEAKKNAPCILFIDEIDALGKRGNNSSGGHDEKEQTLNQLLVELDGINTTEGIILIGATNRPEMLDPALMRPGRIDRQITVELPNIDGREKILELYMKEKPSDGDVELRKIAAGTPGFSGADLANLINEASLLAARNNREKIIQADLENARERILLGIERPEMSMSIEDKRDTAYHETGHAIVTVMMKHYLPLHKVTIIPRGRALGVTLSLSDKERFTEKKEEVLDAICVAMGGRAAEEVFCNTLTSGASNDIEVATKYARNMVMRWGMSELGPMAIGNIEGSQFNNAQYVNYSGVSPEIMNKANNLIQQILSEQYIRAKKIVEENKDNCEKIVNLLMEKETISADEVMEIINREN